MRLYVALLRRAGRRRSFRALAAALTCFTIAACDNTPAAHDQADYVAARLNLLRGHDYAEATCSSCHAIEAGQLQSPNRQAPAFALIASSPGMTALALNAALHTAHVSMPNLKIDGDKLQALSEYILSLKDPALSAKLRDRANASERVHPLQGK